jgi:hypothetical protein
MELQNLERAEDLRKYKSEAQIRADRSNDFMTKMLFK